MTIRTRSAILAAGAVLALGASACSPAPATPIGGADAEAALVAFLEALSDARFDEAAGLFDGDYALLRDVNPDVDPGDLPQLLERWCTQNGGVCLPVREVLESEVNADGSFQMIVTFAEADGSTFEIGPCCGEPDTGQRVSQFAFLVREVDGRYRVLTLPPYVP